MSEPGKILPGIGIALLVAAILIASLWPHRGEVPVEVEPVARRNLVSTVRATGQILPTSYTNVLGQGYGRVTRILVHEGQFVKPGDVLLEVDSVQAAAKVRADQAALASAQAGLQAAEAAVKGAEAAVAQSQAQVRKALFDWDRGQKLYQAQVISRQAFENYRAAYQTTQAALASTRARLVAARGQQARSGGAARQLQAALAHDQDVLNKTVYRAPIAGTVTNIAVRVGENVIPGVPNATGAYLMTISDLSSLMAEVGVNEGDLPLLHVGQPVELQIDAYPDRRFTGRVDRVGAQAILTATGAATSQVTSGRGALQATNYKVGISLERLPAGVRPGMTVATVIQTASKKNAIAVPFQALVLRPKSEVGRTSLPRVAEAGPVEISTGPQPVKPTTSGVQGVFVVRSSRAIFTPVEIGVLGENNVEARKGVQPGEEIVVGGFTALNELHSGMQVKITKRNR